MEEFDDGDFNDLYADVEAQASSAISALHRLAEIPPEGDEISDTGTGGDEQEGGGFTGAGVRFCAGGEGNGVGLTKSPMEDGAVDTSEKGGVNGNEKCLYGGDRDYTSQRKNNSECDSEKRSYRVCKNVAADEESGGDAYSRRANEDTPPLSGSDEGIEISPERRSHAHGSDRTFDSVEDSLHEVSESDSDGTPEKNRTPLRLRNLECDSKKRSYRVCKNVVTDEDSSEDDYSRRANEDTPPASRSNGSISISPERHARGYGSDRTFDSVEDSLHEVSECDSDGTPERNKTSNKNRRNAINTSSSVPSAVSSESSQSRQSSHRSPSSSCSPSPTRPKLFSSSSVRDRRRRSPSIRPGRHCERRRISARKDIYQHTRSNVTSDWNGHLTHKNSSHVTDVRRHYDWHGKHRAPLDFGYNDKAMPSHTSDRRNTMRRSRETDYEALENNRHHNQTRVITPRYPAGFGTRGAQFFDRRYMKNGDRHTDQLDQNIARERRGIERSEQAKRWHDNTLGFSHNLRYIETHGAPERNMGCAWKEMGIGISQYGNVQRNITGHHISHELRYIDTRGIPERNMRRSWREMGIEGSQYGNVRRNMAGHLDWGNSNTLGISHKFRYIETGGTPERNVRCTWKETGMGNVQRNMMDRHDWGNSPRRRHHQHFEVLRSRDQVYKEDYFERVSRNNGRAFGDVAELAGEREVDRRRFKRNRDDRSYQFDGSHKVIQRRSFIHVPQRYRDSVEPPMDIESKKRTPEARSDEYHGSHDLGECNDNRKHRISREDSDDFKPKKNVLVSEGKVDEFLDIEEGQITTKLVECEDVTLNGKGVVKGLNGDEIREIMKKMEERRERFKEPPINLNRESEKTRSDWVVDLDAESGEKSKMERPARKRKWR